MAKFTKQAIYDSFLRFLNEKPLDQITVKDIVDDCGINRKTFYYYFQDIYALTDDMFKTYWDEIKRSLPPESHSWQEILKAIAEYLYDNRKIALHVYQTFGYEKMEKLFYDTRIEYLPGFIRESAGDLTINDEDIALIATYASISISGMLTRWLDDRMKTIPAEMIERFSQIMKGTSRLALENADRLSGGDILTHTC